MSRHILATLAATLVLGTLAACGGEPAAPAAETALEHAEKHLDPMYQCPMHPEVTAKEPGECPICGMDLVPVKPAAAEEARKPLYYRHPHDPTVTSPVPKKDEMGMDFVPVYGEPAGDDAGAIMLSAAMVNNLGVRTAALRRGAAGGTVETVGTVAFDERGRVELRVRAEGYVEQLAVRAAGERVRRGQPLFAVFSPRLAAAQGEYLEARRLGDATLVAAAAARLAALGMEKGAIERLEASGRPAERVAYRAPADGVVVDLGVREGGLAEPGMAAVTIAPLARLWIVAAVPESLAGQVGTEATATVTFPALPGERFEARVIEVLPSLDEMTRTAQVRLSVPNPSGRLAAGMRANVLFSTAGTGEMLLAPTEAVIRTGRAERVIVALGGGRFAAREVVTGREFGDEVEIRAGLEEGQQVVTSGQFMLDSESQVRESLRRLSAEEPEAASPSSPAPAAESAPASAGEEAAGHDQHDQHDHHQH